MDDRKNTVIFTIGRMNPPTSGHMELIKTMMEANLELGLSDLGHGRVYIILSHTKDNIKNPLSCDRKKGLLITNGMIHNLKEKHKPLFDKIVVDVLCTYEPNEFNADCGSQFITSQLCRIIKTEQKLGHTPTNAELILGSDRQGSFTFIPDYFLKQKITFNEIGIDGKRLFQRYDDKLKRIEPKWDEAYIDDETLHINAENMSGTLIRSLVERKQKGRFIGLYETIGLSHDDSGDLYDELVRELSDGKKKSKISGIKTATTTTTHKGMNSVSTSTKSKTPSPPPPLLNIRRGRSATGKGTLSGGRRISRTKHTQTHKRRHITLSTTRNHTRNNTRHTKLRKKLNR